MCIVCNNPPKQWRQVTIWWVGSDGEVRADQDAWAWACCPEHDGLLAAVGGLKAGPTGVWATESGDQNPGIYLNEVTAYLAASVISGKLALKYQRQHEKYSDLADRMAATEEYQRATA